MTLLGVQQTLAELYLVASHNGRKDSQRAFETPRTMDNIVGFGSYSER